MTKAIVTPNFRLNDPESSVQSGIEVTESGVRQRQADDVLDAVKNSPLSTARELATEFNLDRYAVSRRLADLANAGVIRKGSSRRCVVGKRLSCTWYPIDKSQKELF